MISSILDLVSDPTTALITGATTIFLGSALIYVLSKNKKSETESSSSLKSLSTGSTETQIDDNQDSQVIKINVLYGTQTGTAETFCQYLEDQGPNYGFKVNKLDLEEAVVSGFPECLSGFDEGDGSHDAAYCAIFIISTYGEGEPTDNSKDFIDKLKEKCGLDDDGMKDPNWLDRMEYCVFGLGSRAYDNFNSMGKFTDKYLEMAGAKRIMPLGIGDDNEDLERDFEKWNVLLWKSLQSYYESELGSKFVDTVTEEVPTNPYVIEYASEEGIMDPVHYSKVNCLSKPYFTSASCPIKDSRQLISHPGSIADTLNDSNPQSTLHIEIDLKDGGDVTKYFTADNLAVLPENDPVIVAAVAKACSFDLDASFRVLSKDSKEILHLFPTPCTIENFLTRYCDLTSPPRRSELKLLSYFAKDDLDIKVLKRLSSADNSEEYREKIIKRHIGLHDILTRLCPSVCLSLDRFIQIVPRLQPRYYTISSSSSLYPHVSSITVSVLRYQRDDGSWFNGCASTFLSKAASQKEKKNISVYVRESTFRLPSDATKPVIMIGPGTGIAPMRAILQERYHQKFKLNLNIGPNVLYFGCKHAATDQLYKDEIESFMQQDVLTHYYPAFSRDQKNKVYVQHLLEKNKEETWDLIHNKGASIFVCGGIQMGHDVSETLRRIILYGAKVNMDDAKTYLDHMHDQGRFVQELWA